MITAQLICVFVFAYAKSKFSHDAACRYIPSLRNIGVSYFSRNISIPVMVTSYKVPWVLQAASNVHPLKCFLKGNRSLVVRKTVGFPTRSDTNQAVQSQKMARDLKISDLGSRGTVLSV